jgi:addiction module RelE/StbE family toxin
MKFEIRFTPNALRHLQDFKKFEQKIIIDAIREQLTTEPLIQTGHRKPLRENLLSRWELRVRKYRVFYDVMIESEIVEIKAIGYKEHNKLFINRREFEL